MPQNVASDQRLHGFLWRVCPNTSGKNALFQHNKLQYVPILYTTTTLQKHTYSNILKTLPPKNENFQTKNSDIFHISAQNIDCGYLLELPRLGGSNEYPQSMFWAEIRKIMYTPVNPSFTI